jgi:tRNA (guanine26-N2/guanine27-N2)-dimethyltransferase
MYLVPSKTAMYYICQGCQSFYEQPLGRMVEKVHERSGNLNLLFKTQGGPPVPQKCAECGSALHVSMFGSTHGLEFMLLQIAGPMWSGPLHNDSFISNVLEHLDSNQDKYGTAVRMKGMLTVAKEVRFNPVLY